jgi:type II secretory pathway pseudopilin PulG
MSRGWIPLLIAIIPAMVLSFIFLIATGVLLEHVCLEQWPFAIALIRAIPFLLPPAIYFAIDRSLVRTLLMLIVVAILLAIATPGLEMAPQHSKQHETLRRMRTIMAALEKNAARTNRYPDANSVADLEKQLGQQLPHEDAWCHPFAIASNAAGYQIVSYGIDGKPDGTPYVYGQTYKLEDDIVAKDGTFLRKPEGVSESP